MAFENLLYSEKFSLNPPNPCPKIQFCKLESNCIFQLSPHKTKRSSVIGYEFNPKICSISLFPLWEKSTLSNMTERKNNKLTQSSVKNSFAQALSLSEEDALRAQIFGCWSVPLGLPYDENLLVRIKLKLKKDGTIMKSEILDHQRMNRPGQKFYKVLAESALRAVRLCQPLKVPPTGYEKWKNIQLNFDPTEMLRG